MSECVARTLPKRCGRLMMSQARSPLLAEPPLTDQELIDHFGAMDEKRMPEWWVALKLTGADATQDNARSVGRKLMLRLHPDKCKVKGPVADRAFYKLKVITDKIAKRPYSLASAHASGIRPAPAQPPRTATAAGAGAASAGAAKAGAAKAGAPSSKAARPAERQSSWSEADAKARAAAKPRKAPKAAAASSPSASRPAATAATAAADAAAKKKSQAAKRKRAEEASARAAA